MHFRDLLSRVGHINLGSYLVPIKLDGLSNRCLVATWRGLRGLEDRRDLTCVVSLRSVVAAALEPMPMKLVLRGNGRRNALFCDLPPREDIVS